MGGMDGLDIAVDGGGEYEGTKNRASIRKNGFFFIFERSFYYI